MTLLQPRTGSPQHDTGDAEALIKEARRLRRRRWTLGLTVAAVVAAGIGWGVAVSARSPSSPTRPLSAHKGVTRTVGLGLPEGPLAHLIVAGPLAVSPGGALYVANVSRQQVLVRLPDGRFRIIAGNGKKGVSGDGGPAVAAEFEDIQDIAVGADGSLYILDGERVRVVDPSGVISTVAGIPGTLPPPPCCASAPHPAPIANGTPALSVSIDQFGAAAIALSKQGMLYISTGLQLVRLKAGMLDVITTNVRGSFAATVDGQPLGSLGNLGQIAVDAPGNLIVSGGDGWGIWRVAPNGATTEVLGVNARRSGGNTSVLERAPDGVVYGETGGTLVEVQGNRAIPAYAFPSRQRSYFWLTYFAFGPGGTVYADEIPGGSAFEKYQQLRVVRDKHSSVLWQQTSSDAARAQ
jgi:hypothetical protein